MGEARKPGPAPILDVFDKADAIAMYRARRTERQIAEHFGVSRATVQRALADEPRRPPAPKENTWLNGQVRALREQGMTFGQIAIRLNIPRSSAMARYRHSGGSESHAGDS